MGVPELLIILAIVLLLFGASQLPKLARSLGKSSREFKQGLREGAREEEQSQPGARRAEPTVQDRPAD